MQNDTQIRRQLKDVLELARERLFFERDRTGPGAKFRQELDRGQIEQVIGRMNLLDNLDLEMAAEFARQLNRWEFLITAGPLRIDKGMGSPLNPIATF